MTSKSDEILFERRGALAIAVLNRPKALNAATLEMLHALDARLRDWAEDDDVAAVLIRPAEGRGFCAGGDIQRLYEAGQAGDPYTRTFFRDEYATNWRIARFPKPYIALIDGITMGGGVGLSVHGSHRIATEQTMFAMPETGIGFFPDVGGAWFLPRLPGRTGRYMALTGARLKAADCLASGLATHYMPRERTEALLEALSGIAGPDEVDGVLAAFNADPGQAPLSGLRDDIDRLFGGDGVAGILKALEAEGGDWARETAATMRTKAPLSQCVAYEQLRRGGEMTLEAALAMEFRLSQHFMAGTDFYEGVRATVLEKGAVPQWRHRSVEEVSEQDVAACFAPLPDDELALPPENRAA